MLFTLSCVERYLKNEAACCFRSAPPCPPFPVQIVVVIPVVVSTQNHNKKPQPMQTDFFIFRGFSMLKSGRVALGAGSRRFKSSRPDHLIILCLYSPTNDHTIRA